VREQRVEAQCDGRPGKAGLADKIGACAGLAVADEAENRARSGDRTAVDDRISNKTNLTDSHSVCA
jgi:hypothetical protein